jgi:hypothetical protein
MHRAMEAADYYVVTAETSGRSRFRWRWEILRRSRPMGVKFGASGYPTEITAEHAGRVVLSRFLQDLAREERKQSK